MLVKAILVSLGLTALWGCQTESVELTEDPVFRESLVYGDEADVYMVSPTYETTPVRSLDDAADDPAIWLHPTKPEQSLIVGTDKRSGLVVYDLRGEQQQFLPLGLPNNVDIRQAVRIAGWNGDLVAASNRDGDRISFLTIDEHGLKSLGSAAASLPEPYGFCLGKLDEKVLAFVTYKTGETVAHHVQSVDGQVTAPVVGSTRFQTQLEGCDVDDQTRRIFIGEEAQGVWAVDLY
jgi:3-phytase